MKKLLFVRGFTLSNDAVYDEYKQIQTFFLMSEYELEYFKYTTEERLDQVYNRLEKTINNGDYSVIIGHSIGGALVTHYSMNYNVSKFDKIILLMPFISSNVIVELLSKFEFIGEMRVPKVMVLPQSFAEGARTTLLSYFVSALLFDSYDLIGLHQPLYATQHFFLTNKQAVSFFRNNNNIHLIYSKTDALVSFDDAVLSKIKNKILIQGGHMSFSSKRYNDTFFDTLLSILRL